MQPNATSVAATFASRVRQSREGRGWTQEELARHLAEVGLRLDPTAITRIERGDRAVRIEEAVAIAAALRTPLNALLQPVDGVEWDHVNSLMRRYEQLSVTRAKAQEELGHIYDELVDAFAKYPTVADSFRRTMDHPANKAWHDVLSQILQKADAQRAAGVPAEDAS